MAAERSFLMTAVTLLGSAAVAAYATRRGVGTAFAPPVVAAIAAALVLFHFLPEQYYKPMRTSFGTAVSQAVDGTKGAVEQVTNNVKADIRHRIQRLQQQRAQGSVRPPVAAAPQRRSAGVRGIYPRAAMALDQQYM